MEPKVVYVLIGVWSGCIEEVQAWLDKAKAEQSAQTMKKEWGIIEGHEEESPHQVVLMPTEITE
jgi:hypothetical protein